MVNLHINGKRVSDSRTGTYGRRKEYRPTNDRTTTVHVPHVWKGNGKGPLSDDMV